MGEIFHPGPTCPRSFSSVFRGNSDAGRSTLGEFLLGFLAPLLLVLFLDLLFYDANSLVEPNRIRTYPLDFDRREPFAGVLRGFAKRLEMPGSQQEGQIIIWPAENCRCIFQAHTRRCRPTIRRELSFCGKIPLPCEQRGGFCNPFNKSSM